MRARLLFAAPGVLFVIGTLWTSVTPASACSCALPLDDATARNILAQSDLVVSGAVAETAPDRVEFAVERVYAGDSVASATVAQPEGFDGDYGRSDFVESIGADCSYAITGSVGERYLLVLNESERIDGAYDAQGCDSMSYRLTTTDDYFARSLEAIERVAGPGVTPEAPVEEGDGSGFPWTAVLAVAGGAVVGMGAVAAVAWTRGRQRAR